MNNLSETQIAWLAGLIEGEGCINFNGKNGVTLTIAMTDQDIINKVQSITGVGKIYLGKKNQDNRKVVYSWQLRIKQELELLFPLLIPHMGERRTHKINEAIIRLQNNSGKNNPIEHGTYKGYKREEWQRVPFCQPCKDAYNERRREKRRMKNLYIASQV